MKQEEGIVTESLDHPHFREDRQRALAEFSFPDDISYDDFNRQTGGLTRTQYIHYLNKTYHRTQKIEGASRCSPPLFHRWLISSNNYL